MCVCVGEGGRQVGSGKEKQQSGNTVPIVTLKVSTRCTKSVTCTLRTRTQTHTERDTHSREALQTNSEDRLGKSCHSISEGKGASCTMLHSVKQEPTTTTTIFTAEQQHKE